MSRPYHQADPSSSTDQALSSDETAPHENSRATWFSELLERLHQVPSAFLAVAKWSLEPTSATSHQSTAWDQLTGQVSPSAPDHYEHIQCTSSLQRLLESHRFEAFEDGMKSDLEIGLEARLRSNPEELASGLTALVSSASKAPQPFIHRIELPLGVAIRWIADQEDPRSAVVANWIAEYSLWAMSPAIRDGAIVALQNLGTTSSVPALEAALEREPLQSLKDDIQAAIAELSALGDAVS